MNNDILNAVFFAEYTTWTIVWAMVVYYYFKTAHTNWRDCGGEWKHVPREMYCGLKWALFSKEQSIPDSVKYPPPHYLLITIALSGMAYVLSGLNYILRIKTGFLFPNMVLLIPAIAIIAGLGHLIHPFKNRLNRWRWIVIGSGIWFVAAIAIFLTLDALDALPTVIEARE